MTRWWLALCASAAIATAVLEFLHRHEAHAAFWWHVVPLFDFVFGLVGCLGLILGAQWLGHQWLQRSETYYAEPPQPSASPPHGLSREETL
jgi:hypothetical protein